MQNFTMNALFLIVISSNFFGSMSWRHWQSDPYTCGYPGPIIDEGVSVDIARGNDAKNYAWPWMVSLVENGDNVCGASIIDPNWVITAAHCIDVDADYELRAGSISLTHNTTYTQKRSALQVFIHPDYNVDGGLENDIALINLTEPFNISKNYEVNTICLPTKDMSDHFKVGWTGKLTGWGGYNTTAHSADILQEGYEQIFDELSCNKSWNGTITAGMLCTGIRGSQSCQGDSGGPLVGLSSYATTQSFLVGIVSFGQKVPCGEKTKPSVRTRVTEYEDWIRDTVLGKATITTSKTPVTTPRTTPIQTPTITTSKTPVTTPRTTPIQTHKRKDTMLISFGVVFVVIAIVVLSVKCRGRWCGRTGDRNPLLKDDTMEMSEPLILGVLTSANESNVAGFISALQRRFPKFNVRFFPLPYNNVENYTFTGKDFDIILLCHSINYRRLSIINVEDGLYDEFLANAEKKLGKARVGVVVHDIPRTILVDGYMNASLASQRALYTHANLVMIAERLDKSPPILSYEQWEEVDRFLKDSEKAVRRWSLQRFVQ